MTSMRQRVRGVVPPRVIRMLRPADRAVRRARASVLDAVDGVRGRDPLTPPRSMWFVGDGDFRAVGDEFLRHFVGIGGLQPDERVLDVGCGIGRMAVPLTGYLSPGGAYRGFDIVKLGIDWCDEAIAGRYPNFAFVHADVYNLHYNPGGVTRAAEYRFPYDDAWFDFAFLTSVFTHMLPPDLEHYLAEIARVLRPGGRCLMTLFLLDDASRAAVRERRSTLDFSYPVDGCMAIDPLDPEAAIAYDEAGMRARLADAGFRVEEPVRYGSWSGRPDPVSYQDIVLVTKIG